MEAKKNISIVGAGLVGSMWACFMAKKGHNVNVFERRGDMRIKEVDAGKSINLALSTRGWQALKELGMEKDLKKIAIPMKGRMIHQEDGTQDFQAYGKKGQAIYSISRGELNKALMNRADEDSNSVFHFDYKCEGVDLKENKLFFTNKEGTESVVKSDYIFGADGAFSAIRYDMQRTHNFNYSQQFLEHGYKELCIPPNADGTHKLEKNALHIWPRKSFMLIALPNLDGSFTVTLFLQFKGKESFETLDEDHEIIPFFQKYFPTALQHIPNLIKDYKENPTGSLVTVKCSPWHYKHACLLGDAAHAVVPFYGQGMNAGFQDCYVLNSLLDKHSDKKWEEVFDFFSEEHAKNGQAIADLAVRNFIEMRDDTADDHFLQRKKLELNLMNNYPDLYKSQYQMVTFTTEPYYDALTKGDKQTAFAEQLLNEFPNQNNWNNNAFDKKVKAFFGV